MSLPDAKIVLEIGDEIGTWRGYWADADDPERTLKRLLRMYREQRAERSSTRAAFARAMEATK
jgi:hypothetical protein